MNTHITNVLVYGWYNNRNLGDELFKIAFQKIFNPNVVNPKYFFRFVNCLTKEDIDKCDVIFFGGGSFLDNPIQRTVELSEINKPILYIGVGLETNIHSEHVQLLSRAKLIAARSSSDKISSIQIPDLVYSIAVENGKPKDKTLLFLPNTFVLPKNSDLNWKFSAWNHFKSEVSQFLDEMIEDHWDVRMYPMCQADKADDCWAAGEILGMMRNRSRHILVQEPFPNVSEAMFRVIRLIRDSSIVFTQRFHGIVLSNLLDRPYVSISHHDKLEPDISYYGMCKKDLHNLLKSKRNSAKCNRNFDILKREVARVL